MVFINPVIKKEFLYKIKLYENITALDFVAKTHPTLILRIPLNMSGLVAIRRPQ